MVIRDLEEDEAIAKGPGVEETVARGSTEEAGGKRQVVVRGLAVD